MTLTRKSKKTSQERASQKTAKRLRNMLIKREKRSNARAAEILRSIKKRGNYNNAVRTLRNIKNSKYNNNNFKFR